MLHTLNKAWTECFLKGLMQTNKNFLFVVKDKKEVEFIEKIIRNFFQVNVVDLLNFGYYCIVTEAEILQDMIYFKDYFPMWDDILISSNIHDLKIKDFLHKHRERKY